MGSKNEPGSFDCYHNARPDEPMFILLARDPSASAIVKWWSDAREAAIDRGERPESDRAVVEEARRCAKNMMAWRAVNDGKWRASPVSSKHHSPPPLRTPHNSGERLPSSDAADGGGAPLELLADELPEEMHTLDEPDEDWEVIVKMRAIAREAIFR
jgi:hypothetical protein